MNPKKEALFLRIAPDLIAKLKKCAEKEEVSLNSYCTDVLQDVVSERTNVSLSYYESIVEEAKDFFKSDLRAVILFGSRARGNFTSESDIDLLFVVDSKVKIQRAIYTSFEKGRDLPDELSIHIVNLPESCDALSGIWCEVALEGVVLFDSEMIISRFLSNVRELIVDGTYVGKYSHGHRYWTFLSKKEAA